MKTNEIYRIENLPRGLGACIGAFIRQSFIINSKSITLIGVYINGQAPITMIGSSTALVTDVITGLVLHKYRVTEEGLRKCEEVKDGNSSIYVYKRKIVGDSIKLGDFSEVMTFVEDSETVEIAKFHKKEDVVIELVFKVVDGTITPDISRQYMSVLANTEKHYIAIPANNRCCGRMWTTVETDADKEILHVMFDGDSTDKEKIKTSIITSIEYIIDNILDTN